MFIFSYLDSLKLYAHEGIITEIIIITSVRAIFEF